VGDGGLYVGVENEKELIFTGLLYLGKTPVGYAINFKTERISIEVVEVVIVVVALTIAYNYYDLPIRSWYA